MNVKKPAEFEMQMKNEPQIYVEMNLQMVTPANSCAASTGTVQSPSKNGCST